VNHSTTAIRFRFSAAQMCVLWPGLDLITSLHKERNTKDGIRFEYPFRMYPPPAGFDRGAFDQEMMNEILALWERLHPKSQTGGRMQMNAVELRAAIFAIRANISYVRRRRNDCGTKSPAPKNEPPIDDESFELLKIASKRVIHSLERRMKRANNALLKSATREEYAALMGRWRLHLRWMHLRLVWFKPLRSIISSGRIRQQQDLDELMKMAERGLQNAGYQPPEARELRQMMRLFARSARRFREGGYFVRTMLEKKTDFRNTWYLGQFVLDRLTLEEMKKS
jgi:hypothetical protein